MRYAYYWLNAIDTPGGNLSLVKNIKAQTTALSFEQNQEI